jgi:hypothetical protein
MWRIPIEYFTDLSETAVLGQVLQQRLDKFGRLFFALAAEIIHLQKAFYERPHQIRPDRALVIGLVPLLLLPGVDAFVAAVVYR